MTGWVADLETLRPGGAGMTPTGRGVTTHLYVEAATVWHALTHVEHVMPVALGKAGIGELEIVEVTVTEWDRFERQLEESTRPGAGGSLRADGAGRSP